MTKVDGIMSLTGKNRWKDFAMKQTGFLDLGERAPELWPWPWPCIELEYDMDIVKSTIGADQFPLERKNELLEDFDCANAVQVIDWGSKPSELSRPTKVYLLLGLGSDLTVFKFEGTFLPLMQHLDIVRQYECQANGYWKLGLKELKGVIETFASRSLDAATAESDVRGKHTATTESVAAATAGTTELAAAAANSTTHGATGAAVKKQSADAATTTTSNTQTASLLQPSLNTKPATAHTSAPSVPAMIESAKAYKGCTSSSRKNNNVHADNDDDVSEMEGSCYALSSPGCGNTIVTASPPKVSSERSSRRSKKVTNIETKVGPIKATRSRSNKVTLPRIDLRTPARTTSYPSKKVASSTLAKEAKARSVKQFEASSAVEAAPLPKRRGRPRKADATLTIQQTSAPVAKAAGKNSATSTTKKASAAEKNQVALSHDEPWSTLRNQSGKTTVPESIVRTPPPVNKTTNGRASSRRVATTNKKRSVTTPVAESVVTSSSKSSTVKRAKKTPADSSMRKATASCGKTKIISECDSRPNLLAPPFSTIPTSPIVAKAYRATSILTAASEVLYLPDQKRLNGEKLEACLEVLKTSYQASSPVVDQSAMPHLANNLLVLEQFIRGAIDSEGANGGKENDGASIYVCGGPGIGKTSGVKFVCEKVIQAVPVDDDCRSPLLCYVNAVSVRASTDPMSSLFGELASSAGSHSFKSSPASLKQILSRNSKQFVVLVLDEIDTLVSDSKLERYSKAELALSKVFGCAADENYPLVMIGISNTIGSDKYERLNKIGKFQRTIEFCRYTAPELQYIIERRVGTKVIEEAALRLMTNKVAKASGDVRAALDMVADAVKYRLQTLSSVEYGAIATMTKPLVTLKDHIKSSQLAQDSLAERIRGIPLFGKIVLCVMVTLARKSVQLAKVHDLRECVTACLTDFPDELQMLSPESFQDILGMLVDQNVLKMDRVVGGAMGRLSTAQYQHQMVRLGTQLQDVGDVVQKDLIDKQGFWAKIEHQAREYWNLLSDKPNAN
ncbi:hypothetical protein MPSEU_000884400 [Mayamaea pseudoterrestris]|nr:hypothetical protein MPSEU_000884400 [Mayamaea pseudoterrestris]